MDILRFLFVLPLRLVRGLFHLVVMVLRPVFGSVSWSPPAWAPAGGAAIRRRPRRFAGGVLGAAVLAAAAWGGWHWYVNRPKPVEPERITFQAKGPDVNDYVQADGTATITV